MICYTLKCSQGHSFDSWFQSATAFDRLMTGGLVSCAICGGDEISKAVMAPRVQSSRKKKATADKAPVGQLTKTPQPAEKALREMRRKIEAMSENVGSEFAREARAIHHGDAPERPIIGEARMDEAKSLIEDGIPVAPLPWASRKTN